MGHRITLIDFLKPAVNQGLASNFCLRFDIHLKGACLLIVLETFFTHVASTHANLLQQKEVFT